MPTGPSRKEKRRQAALRELDLKTAECSMR
ncbi:hypothetical protein Pan241w_48390 [Gimesia alba]|uniref:Uncharacterized protein n=1 Tax=Gimesia alba TaxID=2527973 RepID=A0A517RLG5_9PLAN|nr:hypothetical protein Pan241w_48390 [Gimesia alba]